MSALHVLLIEELATLRTQQIKILRAPPGVAAAQLYAATPIYSTTQNAAQYGKTLEEATAARNQETHHT